MSNSIAIYIHFPFCRRKCYYCSFVSYQGREAYIPAYVSAIKKELAARVTEQKVSSIYLGGGTPSILPSEKIDDIYQVAPCGVARSHVAGMPAIPGFGGYSEIITVSYDFVDQSGQKVDC